MRFWTRSQERLAEEWIDDVLYEVDLAFLKPFIMNLLERFCDRCPRIPNEEKQSYLAAAIIIASKFEEDEAWLEPSDMLPFYTGPLKLGDHKNQLIRLEREILYCIQWKLK